MSRGDGYLPRLGLKYETMEHYSHGAPHCAICGCHDLHRLQLDHSNDDGKEHREQMMAGGIHLYNTTGIPFYHYLRKRGYPDDLGLQVLCDECNYRKGKPKKIANLPRITISIGFDYANPIPNAQAQPLWGEMQA